MVHDVDHQSEHVRVLREWKNCEETIKHMEDQERAYIKRITELQNQLEAIKDILHEEVNLYKGGRENWTILYRRIEDTLKSSEFKEKADAT